MESTIKEDINTKIGEVQTTIKTLTEEMQQKNGAVGQYRMPSKMVSFSQQPIWERPVQRNERQQSENNEADNQSNGIGTKLFQLNSSTLFLTTM